MEFDLREYFRAAFEDKLLVRMPDREDDFLTTATRLLEKKREMIEVEQALSTQKEEFQMKTESLQQRCTELDHKEEKLKDSLFKFDKFLKENDSKRKRALRKATKERQLAAQKEKEVIRLHAEYQKLQACKESLLHRKEKTSIYQTYLQKVLEKTEEFIEVQEMIDRFKTLMATQEKLLKRELKHQEKTEKEKARLLHYKEEARNLILELNNQLADLQVDLERAEAVVLEGESRWAQIQNTAADITLRLGQTKIATLNLFQIITKQMNMKADVAIEDTEGQLEMIKIGFVDLETIYRDLKKGEITSHTPAVSSAKRLF